MESLLKKLGPVAPERAKTLLREAAEVLAQRGWSSGEIRAVVEDAVAYIDPREDDLTPHDSGEQRKALLDRAVREPWVNVIIEQLLSQDHPPVWRSWVNRLLDIQQRRALPTDDLGVLRDFNGRKILSWVPRLASYVTHLSKAGELANGPDRERGYLSALRATRSVLELVFDVNLGARPPHVASGPEQGLSTRSPRGKPEPTVQLRRYFGQQDLLRAPAGPDHQTLDYHPVNRLVRRALQTVARLPKFEPDEDVPHASPYWSAEGIAVRRLLRAVLPRLAYTLAEIGTDQPELDRSNLEDWWKLLHEASLRAGRSTALKVAKTWRQHLDSPEARKALRELQERSNRPILLAKGRRQRCQLKEWQVLYSPEANRVTLVRTADNRMAIFDLTHRSFVLSDMPTRQAGEKAWQIEATKGVTVTLRWNDDSRELLIDLREDRSVAVRTED